jgi:Reverse transcriptase (RNA-dependent DNA polymerase)
VRITPHSALPAARLKAFSRFKYCVVTDVSRFYPSIYTHSIPWAINGKSVAKTDFRYNSANVFGNRLDFLVRQAQSRQTMGIPVGPDVSRIVAEVLLCSVDVEFSKQPGSRRAVYLRHVDDYCIGGNSADDCEKSLNNLRSALRTVELDINEFKTRIVTTNKVLGESWPIELGRDLKLSFDPYLRVVGYDTVAVLGKIIDYSVSRNDDGIIRHTIRVADRSKYWETSWQVLEHFIAQCAVQFPHSFDYVARVIAWRIRRAKAYDAKLWAEVSRTVLLRASSLGRDSEVLWALWFLKEMNVQLPKST